MSRSNPSYLWLAVSVSAILLVGSLLYFDRGNPSTAFSQTWEAARPRLKNANEAVAAATRPCLKHVQTYFDELLTDARRQRFSDQSFSRTAEFKVISSGQSGFGQYVSDRFATLVFSERDLKMLLARVITPYAHGVAAADKKLVPAIWTARKAQALSNARPGGRLV